MRRLRDNVLHNLGHAFWERNKNFGLVWGGGRGRDLSVLNVSGKDYRRLPSGALSCYLSVFIRIHICACVYRTVCVRSYVWRYFIHVGLQRFSLVPCQAQPLVCVSLTWIIIDFLNQGLPSDVRESANVGLFDFLMQFLQTWFVSCQICKDVLLPQKAMMHPPYSLFKIPIFENIFQSLRKKFPIEPFPQIFVFYTPTFSMTFF